MTGKPEDARDDALPFSSVSRLRDGELTVLTVRGEATPAMLIGAYREFLAEPTTRVLWDMRNGWLARLAHDQLRWSIGQLIRSDGGRRPQGRSATRLLERRRPQCHATPDRLRGGERLPDRGRRVLGHRQGTTLARRGFCGEAMSREPPPVSWRRHKQARAGVSLQTPARTGSQARHERGRPVSTQ